MCRRLRSGERRRGKRGRRERRGSGEDTPPRPADCPPVRRSTSRRTGEGRQVAREQQLHSQLLCDWPGCVGLVCRLCSPHTNYQHLVTGSCPHFLSAAGERTALMGLVLPTPSILPSLARIRKRMGCNSTRQSLAPDARRALEEGTD